VSRKATTLRAILSKERYALKRALRELGGSEAMGLEKAGQARDNESKTQNNCFLAKAI
jgi:hypothetical protein